MCGLHNDERRKAVFLHGRLLNLLHHSSQSAHVFRADPKLPRVGPPLCTDCRRLRPDHAGAAFSKALIAAQRQGARPSVRRAVTAFHRLNHNAVWARFPIFQPQRLRQHAVIFTEGQCKPQPPQRLPQLIQRAVMKRLMLHIRSPPVFHPPRPRLIRFAGTAEGRQSRPPFVFRVPFNRKSSACTGRSACAPPR